MVQLVKGLFLNPLSLQWHRQVLRLWHQLLQLGPPKQNFQVPADAVFNEGVSGGRRHILQLNI